MNTRLTFTIRPRPDVRVSVLILAATLFACASGATASNNAGSHDRDLTANSEFNGLCVVFATGYRKDPTSGRQKPTFGRDTGTCNGKRKPFVLSVTHESPKNNHIGAANYANDIDSYMADFDYGQDVGQWIKFDVHDADSSPTVTLGLDTVDYKKINVTGWPLQYGHLFLGFGDSSFSGTVADSVSVEFDVRIQTALIKSALYKGYSGQRIIVGVEALWPEAPPRANSVHFMEVDLVQADGYTESYGDPARPLCNDAAYDRCYYDPQGRYSEGREVRLSKVLHVPPPALNGEQWVHVTIPLSQIIRGLHWVSPPKDWSAAKLTGLYFAIESEGATQTLVQFRRYRSYAAH